MLSPGGVPAGSGTSRLLVIVELVLLGGISLWLLRRKQSADAAQTEPSAPPSMASRIDSLMRDRQFFRRPNLRVADVARELGTNNTYVSACINGETGLSFPDYVAGFRICYAQELLRNYPDKLLSEVASESGFISEKSFFRTFKDVTGVTPGEWKKSH
jgi:AraC-like DNA-binding protein